MIPLPSCAAWDLPVPLIRTPYSIWAKKKCVYHLANYLLGLPHPPRIGEGSSKGHRAYRLPQGRISHVYNIPNRCLSNLFLKPANVEIFQAPQFSLQILNDLQCPELSNYNLSHSPIKFNLLICPFKGSAQLRLHLSLLLYESVFTGWPGASALLLISFLSRTSLFTYRLHPPISPSPSVWCPQPQKPLHQAFIFTFRNFPPKLFSSVSERTPVHSKTCCLKDSPQTVQKSPSNCRPVLPAKCGVLFAFISL